MILVSACLAGVKCSWDGKSRSNPEIKEMVDKNLAIVVCPEVLGGRSSPRTKTEIRGGAGADVLDAKAEVLDENGVDVTDEFIRGAYKALDIAKKNNIKEIILKPKSPSCGIGRIYDGSFTGKLINGDGVTTALLKREGILCQCI